MIKGIITIAFIVIIGGGIYLAASIGLREVRASMAQKRGDAFVQKLYSDYVIAGESCQGEDTDGDSYVSCDFRLVSASGQERVVHLQCPDISKSLLGNTCKESRLTLPQ